MKRIDTSTRFADLFGSGKHGFRDGDRATSVLATQLNASWCNALQEELANVIEAAGITLNGSLFNQLLAALNAGWNLPKSHAVNGYQVQPGGLIVQWGQQTATGPTHTVSPLPTVWSSGPYIAVPIDEDSSGGGIYGTMGPSSVNSQTFIFNATPAVFRWFAIGK
jgi:hypothetical protein